MKDLKAFLDAEYRKRNDEAELIYGKPDPLMVAKPFADEKVALVCALFAYGNAKQIVTFLRSLDFTLLYGSEREILRMERYYRFQKPADVTQFFITIKRATELQEHFLRGYRKENEILDGLASLISYLRSLNSYSSYGYDFLLGNPPQKGKTRGVGTYKRWNMFLRWMVREDNIDMGLWKNVRTRDLIVPLDTHTFQVSRKVGLLERRSYDLQAALDLTYTLHQFCPDDPVRYDFALYRLGQERFSVD